jgi:DNA-directed RNA polymerase specialized sigma24 family protein
VSGDVVGDVRGQYRSLVVAACEWRAYGIEDPDVMADRVFAMLDPGSDPALPVIFRAIDRAVAQAYRNSASQRSSMDALRAATVFRRDTALPPALTALSSLGEGDRRVLQHAYWDDLEPIEIGEVLGVDLVVVFRRLTLATHRLGARLERHGISEEDLVPSLREAKPGTHRR